jgi:hypothetical protein
MPPLEEEEHLILAIIAQTTDNPDLAAARQ